MSSLNVLVDLIIDHMKLANEGIYESIERQTDEQN